MFNFKVASPGSSLYTVRSADVNAPYRAFLVPSRFVGPEGWPFSEGEEVVVAVYPDMVILRRATTPLPLLKEHFDLSWFELAAIGRQQALDAARLAVLRDVHSCGYDLLKRTEEICQSLGKIEAIKFLRNDAKMGLKEAKDVVEALF